MRKINQIKRAADVEAVQPGLLSMTKAELVTLARERGLKGVPEGWKRETLLAKLQAL
jgi:hypothetical protein